MHSTHRYRCASVFTFFVLLVAFVLYLLAALSMPIIKAVYLFQVNFATAADEPATSIATNFRFGVWGFCASSALNAPTILTDNGECTQPKLGYTIPQDILNLSGYPPQLTDAVEKSLTALLVMHPVTAGLALVTLFFSLFLRSECMTVFTLIVGIITAVAGSLVLAADLAIVIVANHKLHQELGNVLVVSFEDGIWMIVAAVALSWLAVILLSAIACRCCGIRRKHGWYGDGYYG